MDETILFPSPNWFQPNCCAISNDGWLFYGGPSKSLCVLQPLPANFKDKPSFQAHVFNKTHKEKITCVDVSPEWPVKKFVLTGSMDGTVKQWSIDEETLNANSAHSHEIHRQSKEEVVGVGYFKDGYAVTVGSSGIVVKWDLSSNVAKSFNQIIKSFKPIAMACSPHLHLNVAIGTKQGVVFVFDLNGAPRQVYKVRCQDEEILQLGWCPQYQTNVSILTKEVQIKSIATQRMDKIRQTPEDPSVEKVLNERVAIACACIDKPSVLELIEKEANETQTKDKTRNGSIAEADKAADTNSNQEKQKLKQAADESGIGKTLPDDSFDTSIVQEDDMFDIYKEPEIEEFGHKKYEPEDILVKIPGESTQVDYLAECQRLKEEILKRKIEDEQTISSLVAVLDATHVKENNVINDDLDEDDKSKDVRKNDGMELEENDGKTSDVLPSSVKEKTYNHLLATIGRNGSLRIWSNTGKQVGSCIVPGFLNKNVKGQRNTNWTSLHWYAPDVLLVVDGKNQLMQTNPLQLDSKNKLDCKVVHAEHKRSIYFIISNAPLVQTGSNYSYPIWTYSQDRNMVCYSMVDKKVLTVFSTCGGYLYYVAPCPHDAKKMAISVGDGAVRIWEVDTDSDNTSWSGGHVSQYWQNVQGKVLTVAWHPTREELVAFGTAESRVGLIDIHGKGEKPAKVLLPSLQGGVYSLCWGEGNDLYACAGGEVVVYNARKIEDAPKTVKISFEGQQWEVASVKWYAHAMVVGSQSGAVAVVTPTSPYDVTAAMFVFSRNIHTIDWHPQETSDSSEESPFKNLIAVCSMDKKNTVVVLEYGEQEDGTKQLTLYKTLSGHKAVVHQVYWSPHIGGQLLSTSADATIRIWNAIEGTCVSIYNRHSQSSLGATWSPLAAERVISGGADCCLRLWNTSDFPAAAFNDKPTKEAAKKKKKEKKSKDESEVEDIEKAETSNTEAAVLETKVKAPKKFLLPLTHKQMNPCKVSAVRRMFQNYLLNTGKEVQYNDGFDLDFLKIFGSINEVNEVLDMELERHEDMGQQESWLLLCVLRGHIDRMIQQAMRWNCLDPFLLNLAPGVSFKYWKDATQLYLAQIDRHIAKGEDPTHNENGSYGGSVFRKVALLLSLHDVRGAVAALVDVRLFKEAYVLCRTRYMDSIAQETLEGWAAASYSGGSINIAAVCYLALGDLSKAATVLSKSNEEETLSLAAEIAKELGQTTFAGHVEEKRDVLMSQKVQEEKDVLSELPSRVELALEENRHVNMESDKDIEQVNTEIEKHIVQDINVTEETGQGDGKDENRHVNGGNKKEIDQKINKESEKEIDEDNVTEDKGQGDVKEKNDAQETKKMEELQSGIETLLKDTEKALEALPSKMQELSNVNGKH